MRIVVACCLAYALLETAEASAATYYTATTGSDSATCAQAQAAATPKRSIGAGLSCLVAGDTLIVKGGSYNEAIVNNVPSGTAWTNKIRVAAAPGETVWIAPQAGVGNGFGIAFERNEQYIEIDGINVDASKQPYAAVKIEKQSASANPHHIRVQNAELIGNPNATSFGVIIVAPVPGLVGGDELINLTVHGGGQNDFNHGMYLQASDTLVDHCLVYDWPGAGIQVENNYNAPPSNIVIRNTTIRDLRSTGNGQRHWGIIVAGLPINTQIFNNTISGIPNNGASSAAILVYQGKGTRIVNNTIAGGASQGIALDPAAADTVVANNISDGNAGGDFVDSGSNTAPSNNFLGGDPMFENPSARNFRLRDKSPAIDRGTAVAAVGVDAAGVPRPQGAGPDQGAYER